MNFNSTAFDEGKVRKAPKDNKLESCIGQKAYEKLLFFQPFPQVAGIRLTRNPKKTQKRTGLTVSLQEISSTV